MKCQIVLKKKHNAAKVFNIAENHLDQLEKVRQHKVSEAKKTCPTSHSGGNWACLPYFSTYFIALAITERGQ